MRARIGSCRAHLATLDGVKPGDYSQAFGWQKETVLRNDGEAEVWRTHGTRIGWLDGENIYLQPEAAFNVARSGDGGEAVVLNVSTLGKRLYERGVLASTERTVRGTIHIRRMCEGVLQKVWHMRLSTLFPPDKSDIAGGRQSPEEAQARPDVSQETDIVEKPTSKLTSRGPDEFNGPGADGRNVRWNKGRDGKSIEETRDGRDGAHLMSGTAKRLATKTDMVPPRRRETDIVGKLDIRREGHPAAGYPGRRLAKRRVRSSSSAGRRASWRAQQTSRKISPTCQRRTR